MTTTDLLPIGMLVEVHAAGNQWDGCEGRIADQRVPMHSQPGQKPVAYGVLLNGFAGLTLTFNASLVQPLGSVQRGGAARLL